VCHNTGYTKGDKRDLKILGKGRFLGLSLPSHSHVWIRVFVQSFDGEVRKWFRRLQPNSIADIDALDEMFLKKWGDKILIRICCVCLDYTTTQFFLLLCMISITNQQKNLHCCVC